MIKILHSADWHLDAPLQGHGEQLRRALASLPGKISEICREEGCDLVLLAGDLFDGTAYTPHTYRAVYDALEAMAVPVFIAPGNHDFSSPESPWSRELWPENVHIFRSRQVESVVLPALSCRVYGAGFFSMDCPALLENFRADCAQQYAVGVFHGDPMQVTSPYNPITKAQAQASNLAYLALGHVHQAGSFTAGKTLCAWPGCPMGRGYDETGEKGVYIAELGDSVTLRFRPLNAPRFYDLQVEPKDLGSILPPVGNEDFYRITLTGTCEMPDLAALRAEFAHFPNLLLRDQTTRPVDIWGSLGADSFEGVYFGLLRQALDTASEEEKQEILLAAEISRRLLEGQEVVLP